MLDQELMRMISAVARRDRHEDHRQSLIHPLFRIGTAFFCILLCALSRNAVFTGIVLIAELCELACLKASAIRRVLSAVLPAVLFSFLIMLPAIFLGSPASAVTISMKAAVSVMLLALINAETDWKEITSCLAMMHVPGVVIFIMDSTINFLVLLSRFANQMLEAIQIRAVGRSSWKESQIGGVLGTVYLKSQKMADASSEAMICRGFAGEYQIYEHRSLHWLDFIYLFVPSAAAVLFILLERL
jgi:cobalt/nickel transport system permease protein